MVDLELLKNSCERLPKMIESGVPTNILLAEVRNLITLALEAVADSVSCDVRRAAVVPKWARR